jgi:hypothetical protein
MANESNAKFSHMRHDLPEILKCCPPKMSQKPHKKRKAWLITWESSREDYLADLKRPKIVAILRSRTSLKTIKLLLPVLYSTESRLTFSQKITHSLQPLNPHLHFSEMQSVCYGMNPWLRARPVLDLYVYKFKNSEHETLKWTEYSYTTEDPETSEFITNPAREESCEANFLEMWRSFD